MASKLLATSKKLHNFIEGSPIKKLYDLLNSDFNGDCTVPIWFDCVLEGVDMWVGEGHTRFRMKMKVNHGDQCAVFAVYDEVVQNLAMETCPFMLEMGESCSLYPHEMECFYGDSFLCRVEKKEVEDVDNLPSFKIKSLCTDVDVVNMFFDEYVLDFDQFMKSPSHVGFKGLEEISNVYHSSCVSEDGSYGDADKVFKPQNPDGVLPSTNGVVSLVSTGCPSPEDRCYKHKRKCRSNSFGANVGTLVYSRRTIVVRRKLDFGVASAKPIVDSKPSATTVCKEESDLVS